MMRRCTDLADLLLFLLPTAALLLFPSLFADAVRNALHKAAFEVLPAVFPFLVMTRFLSAFGVLERIGRKVSRVLSPLFGLPPSLCGAVIAGTVAGFPNGAAACADVYGSGRCTADEAAKAAAVSDGASLPFCVFFAGKAVCGSAMFGLYLFAMQFLIGAVWARLHPSQYGGETRTAKVRTKGFAGSVTRAVRDASETAVRMTGFIVFFYMIGNAAVFFVKDGAGRTVFLSLCEITAGLDAAAVCDTDVKALLGAFAVGACGVSAVCQTASVLHDAGIAVKPYLSARLYAMLLMPLLALPWCRKRLPVTAVYALLFGIVFTAGILLLFVKRGKKVRKTTEKIGEKD